MTSSATVEGGERQRLFCALTLSGTVLDRLAEWQARALPGRAGRFVPRENLHVTLAFLGGRPAAETAPIAAELAAAAAGAGPIRFRVRRYRETRSVGMVVLEDLGGHGAPFALDVFERLERLGVYERERRPWLPHVTVLRFRQAPQLRPELPDLGEFVPSGAAVYLSRLRPGGAQYVVLESSALGG